MINQNLKFVVVGHVDHGKSTLIGRLLYDTRSLPPDKIEEIKKISQDLGRKTEFAFLLDHLEEERQQGITIETTQTFFKTDKRHYVIIDAPGHVEFVKNMVTGASQAEAAILIVDANEGVKEQTKRHAYMLSLLGLKQVVVVINKMDLVDFKKEKFDNICNDVKKFLKIININPVFYIPIVALSGDNLAHRAAKMGWYTGPIFLECLDLLRNKELPEDKPLLLPVQDVYKVDEKRITVGRIEAGKIEPGMEIRILPNNYKTKVQLLGIYPKQLQEAVAGQSIGITIEDPLFLNRGDIICAATEELLLTDTIKANLFWMSKRDFHKNDKIIIRSATQETVCNIGTIAKRIDSSSFETIEEDADILKNLDVAEVIIKTKKPIAIKSFNDVQELGRFVLELDGNICAGGIIC